MKNALIVISMMLNVFSLFGQANVEKAKKTADQIYDENGTYLYSVLAPKKLTNLPSRHIHVYNSNSTEYTSKLVNTGNKDAAGNEIVNIELYDKNSALSAKIIPDCHIYSMFATRVEFQKPNGEIKKTKLKINREMFFVPNKQETFMQNIGGSRDIGVSSISYTSKSQTQEKVSGQYYCSLNNDSWSLKLGERFIKDHQKLWEIIWDWSEKTLESVKGKSYDELLKNVKINESYLLHKTPRAGVIVFHGDYDSLKVSYKYNSNGNIEEIIFQFPFIDNKYYDKEQFYVKAIKDPSTKLFRIQNKNKTINISDGSYVIPFENRLLLCPSSDAYGVNQVITNDLFDGTAYNMLIEKYIFTQIDFNKLTKTSSSLKNVYETFVQMKTFEQAYRVDKDLLVTSCFLSNYLKAMKK